MRIGPLEFSIRKSAQRKSKPPLGELGSTGADMWRGLVTEDYNPDLRGPRAFETYNKMLRGDGQVQAVELAITLPIRAAAWSVEPGDDSTASREAAELIHANLFGGMTITFDEILRHAMLGALVGVTLFEKVWEIRDGIAAWRKLAPRAPKSINKWDVDIGGGIQGVKQWAQSEDSGYREIRIPIEKLIRLTWRGDYGNPEGRALLRPAYKHWFIKDFLYRIANIAIDRFGVGTPLGRLPEGYSEQDKEALLKIVEDYKSSESAGFVLPPGYDLGILEANLRLQGLLGVIEHHDVMIARCVLAQFVNLGTTASGSRALSEGQTAFFVLGEDAIADWFADHINRYAIPQWCGYNYPGMTALPQLHHSSVKTVLDPRAIAEGLAQLCLGNLLTPDDDIEDMVRGWFDLPPLPDEHKRSTAQPNEPPARATDTAYDRVIRAARARYDPQPHQRRGQQMADDATRFELAMREVVEEQHRRFLDKLAPIIEDFQAAPDASKGRHISRMQAVTVPLVAKYENLLRGWMWELFTVARDRAASEFGATPGPMSNALRDWINTKAQVLASKHSEDLRAVVLLELLEQLRQGIPTDMILHNLGQQARRRASIDLEADFKRAGEQLVDLINNALVSAQM